MFTFSSIKQEGFLCLIILATSKNKVPWVSSKKPWNLPSAFFFEIPAIENGWHGNPPSKISWLGINFSEIFVISPNGTSPKLASYVFFENESHSLVNTHLPPRFWNASLIPPIPANKSINLNLGFDAGGNGISHFIGK